jgi:hypothetical protein
LKFQAFNFTELFSSYDENTFSIILKLILISVRYFCNVNYEAAYEAYPVR